MTVKDQIKESRSEFVRRAGRYPDKVLIPKLPSLDLFREITDYAFDLPSLEQMLIQGCSYLNGKQFCGMTIELTDEVDGPVVCS